MSFFQAFFLNLVQKPVGGARSAFVFALGADAAGGGSSPPISRSRKSTPSSSIVELIPPLQPTSPVVTETIPPVLTDKPQDTTIIPKKRARPKPPRSTASPSPPETFAPSLPPPLPPTQHLLEKGLLHRLILQQFAPLWFLVERSIPLPFQHIAPQADLQAWLTADDEDIRNLACWACPHRHPPLLRNDEWLLLIETDEPVLDEEQGMRLCIYCYRQLWLQWIDACLLMGAEFPSQPTYPPYMSLLQDEEPPSTPNTAEVIPPTLLLAAEGADEAGALEDAGAPPL